MQRLTPTMALLLSEINFSPLFGNSQIRNIRWLSKSAVQAPDQDEIVRTTDVAIDLYKPQIEVLRLRAKGLPQFGARGRGDLDLRIEIKIPERLTTEERALYEKLRGLGHLRGWGRRE